MKEINELVYILKSVLKYDKHEWANLASRLSSKEAILLEEVLSGRNPTEIDMANLINEDVKSGKFRRYKRNLKNLLLSQFLLYEPNDVDSTSFQKNYYKCNQQLAVLRTLKGLTYNNLSKTIADSLLSKSRKYYFNGMRHEACSFLVKYYAIINPDLKKASAYYNESEYALSLMVNEAKISWRDAQLQSLRMKSKSERETLHEMGLQFIIESDQELGEMKESFSFHRAYYGMAYLTYEVIGDFKKALEYAKSGYEYFKQLPFSHVFAESAQLVKMSRCYLHLGQLEDGRDVLKIAELGYRQGSANWYACKYQQIIIHVHLECYNEGYVIYKSLITQRNFKTQSVDIKSFILLVGAYLEFLIRIGKIDVAPSLKKFRLKRFLNQMSVFDSDKERMKIPIIVIELLFSIYNRDYDGMEQKIYSLKDYCSRNLVRKSPNFRSNCFIKMLLEVPLNNFNPIAVKRKTLKYQERLKGVSYDLISPLAEVEIIPYEVLWRIIVEHLQSPRRKRIDAMNPDSFLIK